MRTLFLTFYLYSFSIWLCKQERNRTSENYEVCYDSLKEIAEVGGSSKRLQVLHRELLRWRNGGEHFIKHKTVGCN